MSRSGYSDDCENIWLYRNSVDRAIEGKRGQAFLRELVVSLDAMPAKELIPGELIDDECRVCALGAVGLYRGTNMLDLEHGDPEMIGDAFGIARSMAAEIEYMNDEGNQYSETAEERWQRMRDWASINIQEERR